MITPRLLANRLNVEYKVLKNGVMRAKMEALFQAMNELEDIRRRGGKNSRGIEKR